MLPGPHRGVKIMPTLFADTSIAHSRRAARGGHLVCALLAMAVVALPAARANAADAIGKGVADYKPFAVERIENALAGAKDMQTAVKAGDAKAAQAALIAGKLDQVGAPTDKLVADLTEFQKQVSAASFNFTPQGLLNGATKLAYEIGENKSKGGESPYAGTSINDIYENNEGIEAVYKLVFHEALKARDAKLDKRILDKIEEVEDFVKGKDLK